jgi:hypothetical protein
MKNKAIQEFRNVFHPPTHPIHIHTHSISCTNWRVEASKFTTHLRAAEEEKRKRENRLRVGWDFFR